MIDSLLSRPGRQVFRLVVEDGRVVELKALEGAQDGWLDMKETAARLRHSYFWVSRHWRRLGLNARVVGRVLFFSEAEVKGVIDRHMARKAPGRKKVVVGVIHA